MITLVDRDEEGWWWVVTCDVCESQQLYNTSETIKEWKYKRVLSGTEKHLCPSCKSN